LIHKRKAPQKAGPINPKINLFLLEYGELAGNTEGLLDANHVAAREQNAPGRWTRGICEKRAMTGLFYPGSIASGSRKNERPL
jgi:hypothetical protein